MLRFRISFVHNISYRRSNCSETKRYYVDERDLEILGPKNFQKLEQSERLKWHTRTTEGTEKNKLFKNIPVEPKLLKYIQDHKLGKVRFPKRFTIFRSYTSGAKRIKRILKKL